MITTATIVGTLGNIGNGGMPAAITIGRSQDVGAFAYQNNYDFSIETAIVFIMTEYIQALVPGMNLFPPIAIPAGAAAAVPPGAGLRFSDTPANYHNAIVAAAQPGMANAEHKAYYYACLHQGPLGGRYALELLACCKVKMLNIRNIKSYFLSQDETKVNGASILDWLHQVKAHIPQLMSDQNIRNSMSPTDFMRYHTTYSSTAGIVQEAISFAGVIFSGATAALVNAAAQSPWDRATNAQIPKKAVMVAAAYVKATRKDVGDWYQGEKAVAAFPPAIFLAYVEFFRAVMRLTDLSTILAGAHNIDQIMAAIPSNLLNV